MGERRLILIRHGETEYNATGRMQGQLDTELSEVGRAQAKAAGEALAHWPITKVVCSDLQRAVETAELISVNWSAEITTDSRLRETDLGAWQGASGAEVDRDYPGQRAYWRHDPEWAPPRGETRLDVAARAFEVVQELMESDAFDDGNVVFVAHGGTIGALTSRLLELPIPSYHLFTGLGNVCWSQLVARPRVELTDDADHPETEPAIDGSTVRRFEGPEADWWRHPRWHLEGWNVGISTAMSSKHASPDEGGADGDNPAEGGADT